MIEHKTLKYGGWTFKYFSKCLQLFYSSYIIPKYFYHSSSLAVSWDAQQEEDSWDNEILLLKPQVIDVYPVTQSFLQIKKFYQCCYLEVISNKGHPYTYAHISIYYKTKFCFWLNSFYFSYLNNRATAKGLKDENTQFLSLKAHHAATIFSQRIVLGEFSESEVLVCF